MKTVDGKSAYLDEEQDAINNDGNEVKWFLSEAR